MNEQSDKITPEQWRELPEWARPLLQDRSPYMVPEDFANEVAEITRTAISIPSSTADVFIHWNPHVCEVDFAIHMGGWHQSPTPGYSCTFDGERCSSESVAQLKQLLSDLLNHPGVIYDAEWRQRHGIKPMAVSQPEPVEAAQ